MTKSAIAVIIAGLFALVLVVIATMLFLPDRDTDTSTDPAARFDEGSEEQEIMQRLKGEQTEAQAEADEQFLDLTGEEEE